MNENARGCPHEVVGSLINRGRNKTLEKACLWLIQQHFFVFSLLSSWIKLEIVQDL